MDELIELVGLQRYVDQRADSVPTGVARLLEMARALAIEPALLLLDEPSSGLDEAETEAFGVLLQRLSAEGRAVLMVEHDMDLVMGVCDHIHVLEFGKVIATGTPAEIRADRTVQAAYLGFATTPRRPVTRRRRCRRRDVAGAERATCEPASTPDPRTDRRPRRVRPDRGAARRRPARAARRGDGAARRERRGQDHPAAGDQRADGADGRATSTSPACTSAAPDRTS